MSRKNVQVLKTQVTDTCILKKLNMFLFYFIILYFFRGNKTLLIFFKPYSFQLMFVEFFKYIAVTQVGLFLRCPSIIGEGKPRQTFRTGTQFKIPAREVSR